MNATDDQAVDEWLRGDAAAEAARKREALELFCAFHGLRPAELAAEAAEAEKTGEWLRGYVAESRLREFYAHLVRPQRREGLGLGSPAAREMWRCIRGFYKRLGCDTTIEALASWEETPSELRNLRAAPFGDWTWDRAGTALR
jgi:hypothetical protein